MERRELQYEKARRVMPGGVNSSVRLNRAIGTPFFVRKARGAHVWDLDGRRFLDMCCAHGAALLGHAHPAVVRAVRTASKLGFASMFETEHHEELARLLCGCIPCAERVRFCNSGSEATLHLIRACRAFTGRKKILRVEGHFHGYHELIYIGGQPPEAAFPSNREKPYLESPGIPEEYAQFIVPIPFNDPDALRRAVDVHGRETALLILEPVNFNSGCILPQPGYLELARALTKEAGIVLFFDEIQSAFKKSRGGAQADFKVTPDVCTVGKALGGGLPLSAFCGKAGIMDLFQPVGKVQHSGTFNAPLVNVLAGIAFLKETAKPGFYAHLQALEKAFHGGMDSLIARHGFNMVVPHHGARFDVVLGRRTAPQRYEDTFCHDRETMLSIGAACYRRGVYFHDYGGAAVHHGYSIQHTLRDIGNALDALEQALLSMKDRLRA